MINSLSKAERKKRAHWKLVLTLLKRANKALNEYHRLNMLRIHAHEEYLRKYPPEQQMFEIRKYGTGARITCKLRNKS